MGGGDSFCVCCLLLFWLVFLFVCCFALPCFLLCFVYRGLFVITFQELDFSKDVLFCM